MRRVFESSLWSGVDLGTGDLAAAGGGHHAHGGSSGRPGVLPQSDWGGDVSSVIGSNLLVTAGAISDTAYGGVFWKRGGRGFDNSTLPRGYDYPALSPEEQAVFNRQQSNLARKWERSVIFGASAYAGRGGGQVFDSSFLSSDEHGDMPGAEHADMPGAEHADMPGDEHGDENEEHGAVLAIGLLSIAVLIGTDQLRRRSLVRDNAYVKAMGEIQRDVAISHLWLEEHVSGDEVDIGEIGGRLDRSLAAGGDRRAPGWRERDRDRSAQVLPIPKPRPAKARAGSGGKESVPGQGRSLADVHSLFSQQTIGYYTSS